jgi:pseudouridine synthase
MKPEPIRLQKYLSLSGVSSRREGEKLILAGRIAVNGRVVRELGTRVSPGEDRVEVDGRNVFVRKKIYLLVHKPAACLCSLKDRFGRRLVTDLIRDVPERLYPVGRLDYDSEGLLILTNDGELCQKLTHPRHEIGKTYLVDAERTPAPEDLQRLREGVVLDEGTRTSPADVRLQRSDPPLLEITLREGRKRQVKRMLMAVGNRVVRLRRVAIGPLLLGNLAPGKYRRLTEKEVRLLLGDPDI